MSLARLTQPTTYYQARDMFDQKSLHAEGNMASLAVFRFLLSHTLFNPEDYSRVAYDWSSQQMIHQATKISIPTIRRALRELEAVQMIERSPRWRKDAAGRLPDEIKLVWLTNRGNF